MTVAKNRAKQVAIVHLSDLHFGDGHRFNPEKTPHGDVPDEIAFPSLLDKLAEDLDGEVVQCPVLVCVTGDFVQKGSFEEYDLAERFIRGLAGREVLGQRMQIHRVFVVPGNHDVFYEGTTIGERWQHWCEFHNRLFGTRVSREDVYEFVQLHDLFDDCGVFVLCLNSSIHVQKDKPDEERGRLDIKQLNRVQELLEGVDQERLNSSIRLALIHHHPVLIPPLAEPRRGYDAVHNSGTLLTLLRRHGFQLILHGHKHDPYTFTDDTLGVFQTVEHEPILVVAGGSVGSRALPRSPRAANAYHRIDVKWHPDGRRSRVRVVTRGLRTFETDGSEILPTRWSWETLGVDDRRFSTSKEHPIPGESEERDFDPTSDVDHERVRISEYQRTRGNLAVVEVIPSLAPDQTYDAIVWIVQHPYGEGKDPGESPRTVTWSAGPKFEVITVSRDKSPDFCTRMQYWGPMLVQAALTFDDGTIELVHVYARMPTISSVRDSTCLDSGAT